MSDFKASIPRHRMISNEDLAYILNTEFNLQTDRLLCGIESMLNVRIMPLKNEIRDIRRISLETRSLVLKSDIRNAQFHKSKMNAFNDAFKPKAKEPHSDHPSYTSCKQFQVIRELRSKVTEQIKLKNESLYKKIKLRQKHLAGDLHHGIQHELKCQNNELEKLVSLKRRLNNLRDQINRNINEQHHKTVDELKRGWK